jgi:OmpA-OmpF porin, OOP family
VQLCCRLALLLALFTPAAAWAQFGSDAPDDRAIDLQLFHPAVGPNSYLTVSSAQAMGKGRFQLALGVSYASKPLTVFTVTSPDDPELSRRSDVVSTLVTGHLLGAYAITSSLQVGVVVPMVFAMSGDGLDISTGMPATGGLSARGLGDVRLEVLWRFFEQNGVALAAIPAVTVPTSIGLGSESEFLGDDLPTFSPRAAAEYSAPGGRFSTALNLGVSLRKPRTLYSSDIGHKLEYGAAGMVRFGDKVAALAEVFGHVGFASDIDENPLEIDGAVRFAAMPMLAVEVGGGTGLVRGIGAPALRVFASVSWAPDLRDTDGDGQSNSRDKCPAAAEDKDGWRDDDGCPEDDNDNDLFLDGEDKCPTEAEDKDGFEDDDGCPETDNDKDGYPDFKDACPAQAEDKKPPRLDDGCPAGARDTDGDSVMDDADKCPNDPEDADGYADTDGCPEDDADLDGIKDDADGCAAVAEDKDGFEDDDGCPDEDDDRDGLADSADKCPRQAETINGVNDQDGCPDRGGDVLVTVAAPTITVRKALRWSGASLPARHQGALDQMAAHMKQHRGVSKWRVVVAVKAPLGREVAQQRADFVMAHLVAKGIPADKLEATGALGDKDTLLVAAIEGEMTKPPVDEPPVIEIE